eukprot:SAG31_NODE_27089_length_431_cov_1.364458_1_plen_79_part_10
MLPLSPALGAQNSWASELGSHGFSTSFDLHRPGSQNGDTGSVRKSREVGAPNCKTGTPEVFEIIGEAGAPNLQPETTAH